MRKFNSILDIFPSDEMKEKVNEIVIVIDDLSRRLPVLAVKNINIHDTEFYDGMTYQEFANWICNLSKEMAKKMMSQESEYSAEIFEEQKRALIRLFDVLTVLWWKCYPGIATELNIITISGTRTSLTGVVFKALSENLKVLGYPEFKFAFE